MDISKITDYLYLGTQPKGNDYDILRELNVVLIINTIAGSAPFPDSGRPEIKTIWIPTHDKIWTPIPIDLLKQGAQAALSVIHDRHKVFVHCAAGRHRSAAMAAAILISMGYSAKGAIEIIKRQRPSSDPNAWHIKRRIKKFERYWKNKEISG